MVVSKEQREAREQQRAIEQEEMEVALKDIMESEAGVKIRNSQEIIEVYEEQLFIFHSELQEYLRFRNDLEIGEYKSIENDTGILFEIRYKVNDESAIVSYSIECMDDSQGSEIIVAVNIMVGENVFLKTSHTQMVKYHLIHIKVAICQKLKTQFQWKICQHSKKGL